MTDATADKLAAWELIEKYNLGVYPHYAPDSFVVSGWRCEGAAPHGDICYECDTLTDAVKTWADAAGVPWPSVNVVDGTD